MMKWTSTVPCNHRDCCVGLMSYCVVHFEYLRVWSPPRRHAEYCWSTLWRVDWSVRHNKPSYHVLVSTLASSIWSLNYHGTGMCQEASIPGCKCYYTSQPRRVIPQGPFYFEKTCFILWSDFTFLAKISH